MTALPPAIEAMTAMKKMQINHGPLEQLPELGEFMPGLGFLNVDFNALTTAGSTYDTVHTFGANDVANAVAGHFNANNNTGISSAVAAGVGVVLTSILERADAFV